MRIFNLVRWCSPSYGTRQGHLDRLHTRRMRWQCWARVYPSPIFQFWLSHI